MMLRALVNWVFPKPRTIRRNRPAQLMRARLSPHGFGRLEDRITPAFGIGQNFVASTLGADSGFLPPDTDGAVGPNHYVEFINGQFKVFNKSNGSVAESRSDSSFWTARANVSLSGVSFVSDPRIVYDHSSQRWFASEITVIKDAGGAFQT